MVSKLETKSTTSAYSGHHEYTDKGDYHRELDKNWLYYPVYVEKMVRVRRDLQKYKGKKILDLGCGEGVLVSDLRAQGYDIVGVDFNYESKYVIKSDICATGLPGSSFDVIVCLDVIEHLYFPDQERALNEIHRLLRPGGIFYATLPNLAHFASRVTFLFLGKLLRTSTVDRHPGDRPYKEYKKLISRQFTIEKTFGIFPTYPIVSIFTYLSPGASLWMHKICNKLFAINSFCFLNFFVCRKD